MTEAHKVAVGLRTGPDAAAERLGDPMMPASPESQTATTALGVGDLPLVGSILAPVPIPILWSGMVAAPVLSLLAWLAVRRRRRLDEGLSDLGLPSLPSVQGEGTSPLPPLPEVKHTHVDRIVERPLLPKSESEVANLPGPDDEADAVAEADIYIAYGRYRDAQGLLRQAIARSPHSADLHYKLAETCCSADDYGALAFLLNDMQAQGMDQVYPDQWRLLVERAANGQRPADPQPVRADLRLGPGAPVAGFGQAAPLLSNDVGQDVWTGGVRRFEDDGIAPEGGMHGSDADLELTMEDLAQPTDGDLAALGVVPSVVGASPRPVPQRAAQPGSGPVLPPSVEPAAELTFKPDYDFALDLDTWPGAESTEISPADDLDLNWAEPVPPPGPLPGLGAETTPLQLSPTEPSTAASNPVPFHWQRDGGLWGEVGTKLDLGRAYVEMNDPDAAQAILAEVIEEGDADQQMDARRLLAQLAGH